MNQIIAFKNPISKYRTENSLYKNNRTSNSEYIESAIKILENYEFIQYLTPQEKTHCYNTYELKNIITIKPFIIKMQHVKILILL